MIAIQIIDQHTTAQAPLLVSVVMRLGFVQGFVRDCKEDGQCGMDRETKELENPLLRSISNGVADSIAAGLKL